MFISDLNGECRDDDILSVKHEQEFDRFARVTSPSDGKTCVFVAEKRYVGAIPSCATMVITNQEIAEELEGKDIGLCISRNPKATYFRLLSYAGSKNKPSRETLIASSSMVSPDAFVSPTNVVIGEGVVVEPFATIFDGSIIGDGCVIRSGARIGIQDYNFYQDNGEIIHLEHRGQLILGANVHVGYNSILGRSLYEDDATIISDGCKISNNCAIGHDCCLGSNVMVYAGSVIGGWTQIGDNVRIAMNAVVKNGLRIGANASIGMGSCVLRDIPEGQSVFGMPAHKTVSPR